jgi:uncharacterized protein YfaS (alpha-2-macroglobulin family)
LVLGADDLSHSGRFEGEARLGDTPVGIEAAVTWGEYELKVTRAGGRPCHATFWAGWYAPADVSATPDTLELSLDKPPTSREIPRNCGSCRAAAGWRW